MAILILIILSVTLTNTVSAEDQLTNLSESHPRDGWPNFFTKIKKGKEVRIAFIGGSITVQPGWRPKTLNYFRNKYPETKFTEINAAITGTNSYLGVSRLKRDVLDHHPDLVFIEFAVNDKNGEFSKNTFEGMVRKILAHNITTDICFVYTATVHQIEHLLKGKYQPSARQMELVAEHYRIPTIHLAVNVARLLQEGKLDFVAPFSANGSGQIDNKIAFSPDGAHPYVETGHQLYFEAIERSLPKIEDASTAPKTKTPAALDKNHWQDVKLVSLDAVHLSPEWKKLSPQSNNIAKQFLTRMPAIWLAEQPHASMEFTFHGTAIGLYGVKGPDIGQFLVQIDDQKPFSTTFFYVSSNPYNHYLKSLRIADNLTAGEHTVKIKIDPNPIDKVAMFANRNVPITHSDVFEKQNVYIGDIILKGELVENGQKNE